MKKPSIRYKNLYIEATTNTDPSPSDICEKEFQIDEIAASGATSNTSTNSKIIGVLTQDKEFILESSKDLMTLSNQKPISKEC